MFTPRTLLILEQHGFALLKEAEEQHPAVDSKPAMTLPTDHLPDEVKHVAHSINGAGGKAMLIGGAVRDSLRTHFGHSDKKPKDFDMEVHGMHPDHLTSHLSTLGKNKVVGEKSFGINKLNKGGHEFDISIPSHASFKQGEHGKADPHMPVSKAGLRRDFTMNSVAMDPTTGHVHDPQNGIHDIKHKILRHSTKDAFEEANGNGPIRIMRGAQFAARHGLSVHPKTIELMKKASHRLATSEVASSRVHGEWKKLITKGHHPSKGLDVLKQSGALKHLHPELHGMHDDHWDHTKRAMEHAHDATHDHAHKEAIRYATLFHKTHAGKSANEVAEHARKHFGVNKGIAAQIGSLVEHGHKIRELHDSKDKNSPAHVRRLAHSLGSANIDQLAHVAEARHKAGSEDPHHAGEWLRKQARKHGVHDAAEKPILTGKHLKQLGVKPGPHMGKIMQHVHGLQLDGHVRSEEDALHHARRIAHEGGHLSESNSFYNRIFSS